LPDSIVEINFCDMPNPVSFRYFKTSPEIIQLAVMLYVRFPLSLRNVEDLLHERGVDVRVLSEQISLPLEGLEISYSAMPNQISFRYFKTSPEIIQLAVMLYVRFPLSLRNVEDLLHERGVDVSYESVCYWWHRFGSKFASEIKKRRAGGMQSSNWKWHLDEVFVKINGERITYGVQSIMRARC